VGKRIIGTDLITITGVTTTEALFSKVDRCELVNLLFYLLVYKGMEKYLNASHGVIMFNHRVKELDKTESGWNYLHFKSSHVYYKHPNKSDVTFIVQGRIKEDIFLKLVLNLLKFGHVILSTWSVIDQQKVIDYINSNRIHNGQNVYLQVYSTLEGLLKCKTEYAIKVRADEWYSDFTDFIKSMRDCPNKITTHNMFFRKLGEYPYHLSDHVIGGKTNNLIKMFKMCKTNLEENKSLPPIPRMLAICPEQWLTVAYMRCFYEEQHLLSDVKQKMTLHFQIVPVNTFKDFRLSYTWQGRRHYVTGITDLSNHSHAFGIDSIDDIDT
jgi:predicted RNA binding protein YcfA (HicA-like mRNA interferase family)